MVPVYLYVTKAQWQADKLLVFLVVRQLMHLTPVVLFVKGHLEYLDHMARIRRVVDTIYGVILILLDILLVMLVHKPYTHLPQLQIGLVLD
jgi:hypothetical protein